MQFPVFTSAVLVVLAAIALLINGIARIIAGITFKSSGSSTISIGVGVLCATVSILVIAQPVSFGLVLFAIMISIAFLISGIEMMVSGILVENDLQELYLRLKQEVGVHPKFVTHPISTLSESLMALTVVVRLRTLYFT